jgi:hypothetical protein
LPEWEIVGGRNWRRKSNELTEKKVVLSVMWSLWMWVGFGWKLTKIKTNVVSEYTRELMCDNSLQWG